VVSVRSLRSGSSTIKTHRTEEGKVSTFRTDLRQTIVPDKHGRHGPLPPLLLAMTMVTGLVDAVSYLVLGHVFVANMTGNIVLLGFALAGAPGFSIPASATAVASFGLGALAGGQIATRRSQDRGRLLTGSASVQTVLFAAAVVLAALSDNGVTSAYRYALIVVLALSMGIQNAAARKLAVPDLTTTVLTMTITGIAADSTVAGGTGSKAGRRLIAIAAMLAGALVGATLVIHAHLFYPVLIALLVTAVVAATSAILGKPDAAWIHSES
jgi:uncharacterized membrane protein YoaK (UPF0700 family)